MSLDWRYDSSKYTWLYSRDIDVKSIINLSYWIDNVENDISIVIMTMINVL